MTNIEVYGLYVFFFFQAEDGIRDDLVTGVQTCALPISVDLLKRNLRPSQIITKNAIENAIASVAMTGGSTNAVLHLLAIAHEAGIAFDIDDFDRISSRTPLLADLKPGGRFMATDMYKAGGIPLVAKRLKEAGLLHQNEITVTGKTIGAEAHAARETAGQEVVRPLKNPLKETGGRGV